MNKKIILFFTLIVGLIFPTFAIDKEFNYYSDEYGITNYCLCSSSEPDKETIKDFILKHNNNEDMAEKLINKLTDLNDALGLNNEFNVTSALNKFKYVTVFNYDEKTNTATIMITTLKEEKYKMKYSMYFPNDFFKDIF